MTDADFIEKLVSHDFDIFHSSHPDSAEVVLDPRVNKFEKDWSRIICVVTDYSSIGEDFILSGVKTSYRLCRINLNLRLSRV